MRLVAEVSYAGGAPSSERLWFEVDECHEEALSTSGNAWLAALAPLAGRLGESLEMSVPVDARLLGGVEELLYVWAGWRPEQRPVRVEADTFPGSVTPDARTGVFFSGGVDSFFSVLRHAAPDQPRRLQRLDDLLCVHGLDVALGAPSTWRRVRSSLQRAADALGHELVTVATNFRDTRLRAVDWQSIAHGAALAGVAHALDGRLGEVRLPAALHYGRLAPNGTHPVTDPLFSSGRLLLASDGSHARRTDKTAFLARHPLALRHLRVCFRSEQGVNCGRCGKCVRTLGALDCLGALEETALSEVDDWSPDRLARPFWLGEADRLFGEDLLELARDTGRRDVERALRRGLRRSRNAARQLRLARRLARIPLVEAAARRWKRHLLRGPAPG